MSILLTISSCGKIDGFNYHDKKSNPINISDENDIDDEWELGFQEQQILSANQHEPDVLEDEFEPLSFVDLLNNEHQDQDVLSFALSGQKAKPLFKSFSSVTWLGTNVSSWKQTSKLNSVSVSSKHITLNYDKANKWPSKGDVVANPWIFVKQSGKIYGATWEWMRPGQTMKNRAAVNGNHIKRSQLNNFKPKSGETYGFMVSSLARDSRRTVNERTNVVWVVWP